MSMISWKDLSVTVCGLGMHEQGSGATTVRWLIRSGARVRVSENKTLEALRVPYERMEAWVKEYVCTTGAEVHPIEWHFGGHDFAHLDGADRVVRNPGMPISSPFLEEARRRQIPIDTDISLFLKACPRSVIAVTGTRGKSTTTSWIGEIWRRVDPAVVIGGNLVASPLERLEVVQTSVETTPVVLELSSSFTESFDRSVPPIQIAVWTNLFADHLDRYGSMEAYARAKARMFEGQSASGISILPVGVPFIDALAPTLASTVYWTQAEGELAPSLLGAWWSQDELCVRLSVSGEVMRVVHKDALSLSGEHNATNALSVTLATLLSGVPLETVRSGLASFTGLAHRQELIRVLRGVRFINDTTATSPDGTIAALERFHVEGPVTLILGGASKGLPYDAMMKIVARQAARLIWLPGTATDAMKPLLSTTLESHDVSSMTEAVQQATAITPPNGLVLLSPGAASFGLFVNEFDRGQQFVHAVQQLVE